MAEKILRIEFSHENTAGNGYFYSDLALPATEYEIRDALQKARITDADGGYRDITVMSNSYFEPLSNVRLDSPTIEELNFLSKRLAAMDGMTSRVYEAVISSEIKGDEQVSIKDLINCTYGLDEVMVAADVKNDAELGAFIIENDIHEDVKAVPKDSRYLLNYQKIGEMYRKTFGTVYTARLCVFAGDYEMPEVYDGRQLPESDISTWYAFRLCVAEAPQGDEPTDSNAEWISLPMSKITANRIARLHGAKNIEDCVYYGFESSVPQINAEMFGSMADFDKLNALAEQMAVMSPMDQIKFKAVLEAEKPADMDGILDIAEHLHLYEINTSVFNGDEFFKNYIAHHLDSRFDSEWLDSLLVKAESGRLLDRLGATVTNYGAISSRGQSLYKIVPYNKAESKELTTQTLTDEKLDVIEVYDHYALFSNGRILPEELPTGLYAYDLRQSDDGDRFCSIEKTVMVNHGGTILVKEPFDFKDADFISLNEDSEPNFLGYDLTPQEFMDTDLTQGEDENQELGGMKM